MSLFDNKKPFSLKLYFNAEDYEFTNDSSELPIFSAPPLIPIVHSFGLCVYNVNDIKEAVSCFQKLEPSSSVHHFLYIMGDACRQTDTLEAASLTSYPLIIEKGPFLSPDDVKRMVAKLTHKNFALVECGSSFGYADRVLDVRSLSAIKEVSPYFGVCVTDLFAPQGEVYPHRGEWLANEKFLDTFKLTAESFQPNFYVYKTDAAFKPRDDIGKSTFLDSAVKPRNDMGKTQDDNNMSPRIRSGIQVYPGWDGTISPTVKLSREKLTVIAGPCMLESLEIGLQTGNFLKELCESLGYQYIFKSSFDKANRTSAGGARGPGIEQGIKWLEIIKKELNVPILTDVHSADQAHLLAKVVDVLQIPAFLFREKNLLLACAKTGKTLQIKKGQWASSRDMLNVASFLAKNNFHKVILAERGSCFGYNNLVVDFRNLVDMASESNAVVFDATHAVQLPGAKNGKSSGLRNMVPALTRAALAIGVDGLFMEVHPNPECALSDADTQLSFEMAREILTSNMLKR